MLCCCDRVNVDWDLRLGRPPLGMENTEVERFPCSAQCPLIKNSKETSSSWLRSSNLRRVNDPLAARIVLETRPMPSGILNKKLVWLQSITKLL